MDIAGQIELSGHVENGMVVLDGGASLPEGAQVRVRYAGGPTIHVSPVRKPVVLPIFHFDGQPDIDLTNDQIAEILAREDASA